LYLHAPTVEAAVNEFGVNTKWKPVITQFSAMFLNFVLRPWASECPDVKNYKWRLNPVWHRMLIAVPIWQQ